MLIYRARAALLSNAAACAFFAAAGAVAPGFHLAATAVMITLWMLARAAGGS
jgi:hypothetical protein